MTNDLNNQRTRLNDMNENTTESTDTTTTDIVNAINGFESDSTDCQNQIKDLQNTITKDSARLKKVDIFKIYKRTLTQLNHKQSI